MDKTALLAGLIGALIGSLSSIITLFIQLYFQNKREAESTEHGGRVTLKVLTETRAESSH